MFGEPTVDSSVLTRLAQVEVRLAQLANEVGLNLTETEAALEEEGAVRFDGDQALQMAITAEQNARIVHIQAVDDRIGDEILRSADQDEEHDERLNVLEGGTVGGLTLAERLAALEALLAQQRGGKLLIAAKTGGQIGFGFDPVYRQLQSRDLPQIFLGEKRRHIGETFDDHGRSIEWHRSATRPMDGCAALENALDYQRASGDGRRHVVWTSYGWQFDSYPDPIRMSGALIDCNGIGIGAPPMVIAADATRPILYLNGTKNLRMRGAFHAAYRKVPSSTSVRPFQIRGGASNIYIAELIVENADRVLYLDDCTNIRIGRVIAPGAGVKIVATATAQDVRIGEWVGPGTLSIDPAADVQIGVTLDGLLPGLAGLSPVANKVIRYDATGTPTLIDWILDQSFTPAITCSDGTVVTLTGTLTGSYSKRGKRVSVAWLFSGTIGYVGAGAGDLRMSLPIAADSNTTICGLPMTRLSAFAWPGTATMLQAQPTAGQAYARIMGVKSGGTPQATQLSAFPTGSSITLGFRGEYDAAA